MGLGLSSPEVGLLKSTSLDFGQVHYVVDSDYRTAAQGWSRADRTGPLDLYEARKSVAGNQYVFRTADYASPADRTCIQDAINATVDFRGDVVFFTPGSYSIATTSLVVDSADIRLLGPTTSSPRMARVTLTDAIGDNSISVDRVEVGYIRFVPLTAQNFWQLAAGADNGHMHHFYYDANGIAASTSTIFAAAAGTTNDDWAFTDFYGLTDAAQGPLLSFIGTYRNLTIKDFEWSHEAGTLATCLLLENSAGDAGGPGPVDIRRGRGNIAGGGAVTNLVALTDAGIDTAWISVVDFRGAIGFCAAGALISLSAGTGNTAEAAETGIANSFLDVVGAGAGGAGTAYTQ